MAEISIGSVKTPQEYVDEIYELIGQEFPLQLKVANGQLLSITFEDQWKEGTTESIETGEIDEDGHKVIEYKENYTDKKLTAKQIDTLKQWASENVVS